MVFYICSNVYRQSVMEAVREAGQLAAESLVADDVHLLEYMKKNISSLSHADRLLIDMNCIKDLDDEFIQAVEMYRVMYNESRIIILATNYEAGDLLLTRCFSMGIYDLITTDDFNQVKSELEYCITTGKTYKDSLAYKEEKAVSEKLVIKSEIKQVVSKVMVGVCGTGSRMGTTHAAVLAANFLRNRGFRVALVERNPSGTFGAIRESFEQPEYESGFSVNNVDYFASCTDDVLNMVAGRAYNFIILDMGASGGADMVEFNRCEKKLIICGSKPWETERLGDVFSLFPEDVLKGYHYLFNFTAEGNRDAIRKGMGVLRKNVHFTAYTPDPFHSSVFADGDEIFAEYMPVMETGKKRLFGGLKKWR